MGKAVVIPDHPSNTFFRQFSNTYMYADPADLVPTLRRALAQEPQPMADREAYMLSWEAASERLLDAAALPDGTRRSVDTPAANLAYAVHYAMGVQPIFDVFRTVTGAGPVVPWRERWDRGLGHGSRVARLSARRAAKASRRAWSEADRGLQQREGDGSGRP